MTAPATKPVFGGYLKLSTARTVRIFAFADDHMLPALLVATGDWTIKAVAKDAAAFGAITPTITERAYGWYEVPLTTGHTDTLGELALHLEAPGVDSVNYWWYVTADDPSVASATAAQATAIQADTDDLQTRIPAALVSGRMDASVGAMATDVVTAAAIAADAITAAKIADGAIDAATFAAGAITAAAVAADAIGASELATDAVTEIAAAVAAAVLAATVDGASTVKGVLTRADAVNKGKATGLNGTTAAFFKDDGVTKAIEATQDPALGTRTAASTRAGD